MKSLRLFLCGAVCVLLLNGCGAADGDARIGEEFLPEEAETGVEEMPETDEERAAIGIGTELTGDQPEMQPFYWRLNGQYLSEEEIFVSLRAFLPEENYRLYRDEAYGGMFYDDRGNLVLCVKEGMEELLELKDEFAEQKETFLMQSVAFTYHQLKAAQDHLVRLEPEGMYSSSIQQSENKLLVGLSPDVDQKAFEKVLADSVNLDMIRFEIQEDGDAAFFPLLLEEEMEDKKSD